MMALTPIQRFVLLDCLKKLQQELLQSDIYGFSQDPAFQQTLQRPMEPENIEAVWKGRMRGNEGLAERVAVGLSAVLGKVKVEARVVEEVKRLKDVAENAAMGNGGTGHEYEDLTLSDTETSLHYAIMADQPKPPLYIHPSFRLNSANPPIPKPIFTPISACKGPKLSDTPLYLLRCAKGPRRHPKLENFRLKLIRGMMRSIREFANGRHIGPKSGSHAIDKQDQRQVDLYLLLKEKFFLNKADLEQFGSTQKGPETNKHRNQDKCQSESTRYASYNDTFCKEFLSSETRLDYFQLYLDVVFSGEDCGLIGRRMKARCCVKSQHSSKCLDVWRRVKEFASWGMLERLGLDPPERYFQATSSS
jgi:hypothetical protein